MLSMNFVLRAADGDSLLNSVKVAQAGYKQYKLGNYEEALKFYNQVNVNDSNYEAILTEMVVCNIGLKRFEESIKLSDEGIELNGEFKTSFYLNKGVALSRMDKEEEAIILYKEALKIYPRNYKMHHKIAVNYSALKKYEESFKFYRRTLELNPFYTNTHVNLGSLCLGEGKYAQALMSFIMAILLEPGSDRANSILVVMNSMVSSKMDVVNPVGIKLSPTGDDYSDVDLIIKNYAALEKGYKVKSKIDIPLVRQVQVLFEMLEYNQSDGGFWMDTYVSLFKNIFNSGRFEVFSYYLLKSSNSEKHKKIIAKYDADIKRFIEWAGAQIRVENLKKPVPFKGEMRLKKRWYYEGSSKNGLEALGNKDGEKLSGCWEIYHKSGALKSEGCYNKFGRREGEWLWYHENGNLNEVVNYKDSKLHGSYKTYYESDIPELETNYIDGKIDGSFVSYSESGLRYKELNYKDGEQVGLAKHYHPTGELLYAYSHVDGKIDGDLKEFFENGDLKSVTPKKGGDRVGVYKQYHHNKQLNYQVEYVEDNPSGKWTEYYSNGQIYEEGLFKEGQLEGVKREYYYDGTLSEESNYTMGDVDGLTTSYDKDGVKYMEYDYKNGDLIAYRFFNKKGEQIKSGVKKKGKFLYSGVYPDGVMQSEGMYDIGGGQIGTWKYYTINGGLREESSYENGALDGKVIKYFPSGSTELNYNYEEGKLHGSYTKYYSNEEIRRKGWLIDGLEQGVWIYYRADGTIDQENYYQDGNLQGSQIYYDITGTLFARDYYKAGKFMGSTYYDTLGNVLHETKMLNHTGQFTYLHLNGDTGSKVIYVNGILHGNCKWFYSTGVVSKTATYVAGDLHGEVVSYHENGNIEVKKYYRNGAKIGKWIYYYENGKKRKEVKYIDGMLHGKYTFYLEDGNISSEKDYYYGDLHGEGKFYINGTFDHVRYYVFDKLVAYSYSGESGELVAKIALVNESGKMLCRYKNGQIAREMEIKNGEFVGEYKKYYASGKAYSEGTYVNGEIEGHYVNYYENGNKKEDTDYLYGQFHGENITYYINGKIKRFRNYINDEMHGFWQKFDQNGKLIEARYYYDDKRVR